MKKCTTCFETKKNSEFGRRASADDGLNIYCKSCQRELCNGAKVETIRMRAKKKTTKKKVAKIEKKIESKIVARKLTTNEVEKFEPSKWLLPLVEKTKQRAGGAIVMSSVDTVGRDMAAITILIAVIGFTVVA